jgi:hypothetical protein
LRKSAHLGWCIAEIKVHPPLCFRACLFGSRRHWRASAICERAAEHACADDSDTTKAHEMRPFLKRHGCDAQREAPHVRAFSDFAHGPGWNAARAEAKIFFAKLLTH